MPQIDAQFEGTSHETLPEADYDFSCKSGTNPQNPEVVVDIKQDLDTSAIGQFEDLFGVDIDRSALEDDEKEQWVRIPVTEVEEWVNKDGPADMTRTAKVTFPMEWGGQGIIDFVNGFNSQNNLRDQNDPYDECRIFFYDNDTDQWVINHYGYVGGVGPQSSKNGLAKMWVYDPADLMKGIQVSQSFSDPSFRSLMRFVLEGIDNQGNLVGIEKRSVFDDVRISILGVEEIPNTKVSDPADSPALQVFDAEGNKSIFGSFQVTDTGFIGEEAEEAAQTVNSFLSQLSHAQKRFQINRNNMVDVMDWIAELLDGRWWFEPSHEAPVLTLDASSYKEETEKDVYERRYFVDDHSVEEWRDKVADRALLQTLLDLVDAKGIEAIDEATQIPRQFLNVLEQLDPEDLPQDPADFYDDVPGEIDYELDGFLISASRDLIPDNYLPPHDYDLFSTVDTLENSALADIKPFNTLELYGEATTFNERYTLATLGNPSASSYLIIGDTEVSTDAENVQDFKQAASAANMTEEFPYVKLSYKPLLDRAGGYEYSAPPVESDKMYLRECAKQAKKEFRQHLAEETEGNIFIRGEPYIMPYDYIVTKPVCDDTYPNQDMLPITWEVNGVRHIRGPNNHYETELRVSITLNDSLLDVTARYDEA